MANRSDFFKTSEKTPNIPRYLKKLLALGEMSGAIKTHNERKDIQRLFQEAHLRHVAFRLKRNTSNTNDDVETGEVAS